MRYKISIHGCDDSTIWEEEFISQRDVGLIKRLAKKSEEVSTYACMPTIEIEEAG